MPSATSRYETKRYGEFRVLINEGLYSVRDIADILSVALKLEKQTRTAIERSMQQLFEGDLKDL